ncbi:hypothetical protein MPF_0395 [Methanohalophilus portucalensis FDF-1]|uniref:Uncharacterized protein n=1 Tax=Methanohalophilus portucalensis FDF-1 TaxID=523843 RepID=A0A1L9C526_9EURY|nr:hypothetical protein MPF_0395 [Methanohalophilus portucalensis FDF-1]
MRDSVRNLYGICSYLAELRKLYVSLCSSEHIATCYGNKTLSS